LNSDNTGFIKLMYDVEIRKRALYNLIFSFCVVFRILLASSLAFFTLNIYSSFKINCHRVDKLIYSDNIFNRKYSLHTGITL